MQAHVFHTFSMALGMTSWAYKNS